MPYDGPLAYDDPISLAVEGLRRSRVPPGVPLTDLTIRWRYDRLRPALANLWRFSLWVEQAFGTWEFPTPDGTIET